MIPRTNMDLLGAYKDRSRDLLKKGYLNSFEYGVTKNAFKRNVKSRSRLTKQEQELREYSLVRCSVDQVCRG